MKHIFFWFIAAVCLLLPLPTNADHEKIKVGLIYGDSAYYSASGVSLDLLGGRLAVTELNLNGGILGKQIELLELNYGATPLDARLAARKFAEAGVIAVVAPTTSSRALLAGEVLQQSRIPMISPLATNPEVTLLGEYIFRVCFTDRFQGKALADFALQDLKAKTAVVLTCSGEKYSIGFADIFMDRFKEGGGVTLWEGDYLDTATDFQKLLEKVLWYRPDIVFLPGYGKASGFIIKQSRDMGMNLAFLGGDTWSNRLYEYGGAAIDGCYYSGHWDIDSKSEKSQEFVDRYKNEYRKEDLVSLGLSHDAFFLLADAVSRANSLKPALIRDALAITTNFQGVTGTITMDKNGDPLKPIAIFKFEKGSSVLIKTVMP